jgi:hypothetical protein
MHDVVVAFVWEHTTNEVQELRRKERAKSGWFAVGGASAMGLMGNLPPPHSSGRRRVVLRRHGRDKTNWDSPRESWVNLGITKGIPGERQRERRSAGGDHPKPYVGYVAIPAGVHLVRRGIDSMNDLPQGASRPSLDSQRQCVIA